MWYDLGFENRVDCGRRPLMRATLKRESGVHARVGFSTQAMSTEHRFDELLRIHEEQMRLDEFGRGLEVPKKSHRIAGGTVATLGQFPSFGELLRDGNPICSVTLVGQRLFITAAHCLRIHFAEGARSNLEIVMGTVRTPNQTYTNRWPISNVCVSWNYCLAHVNPVRDSNNPDGDLHNDEWGSPDARRMPTHGAGELDYLDDHANKKSGHVMTERVDQKKSNINRSNVSRNDFALVWVDEPIQYNDQIQPACLSLDPEAKLINESPNDWDFFESAGFGRFHEEPGPNPHLTHIKKTRKCSKYDQLVTNKQSGPLARCYMSKTPGKSCKGDSGSGIFYNRFQSDEQEQPRHYLAGMLSASRISCNTKHYYPDTYVDFERIRAQVLILATLEGQCGPMNKRLLGNTPICKE